MARIAGVKTETNRKGEPTTITINLKKHPQAIKPLTEIGLIEEDEFERKWNNPTNLTIEEARAKTKALIRLWK
jgi:hypothetical protein